MTNEHAKEIMIAYRDRLTSSCSNQLDSDIEAFNLAIKALEDVERLEEENHQNFVNSQHIISCLVEKIKKLRGEEKPQGDLISRKELKEAIRKRLCISSLKYLTEQEKVIVDEIDNAPTVETSKVEHKAYNEGFKDGVEQGIKLSEGLKGEWIDYSDDYGYAECPFCEHLTTCGDNIDELHYCWNCGAKLGKGGEE